MGVLEEGPAAGEGGAAPAPPGPKEVVVGGPGSGHELKESCVTVKQFVDEWVSRHPNDPVGKVLKSGSPLPGAFLPEFKKKMLEASVASSNLCRSPPPPKAEPQEPAPAPEPKPQPVKPEPEAPVEEPPAEMEVPPKPVTEADGGGNAAGASRTVIPDTMAPTADDKIKQDVAEMSPAFKVKQQDVAE